LTLPAPTKSLFRGSLSQRISVASCFDFRFALIMQRSLRGRDVAYARVCRWLNATAKSLMIAERPSVANDIVRAP
jgi:hypothetical protein